MSDIEIVYFTDSKDGENLAAKMVKMGLSLRVESYAGIKNEICNDACILIFDITGISPQDLLKNLSEMTIAEESVKLILTEPGGLEKNSLSGIKVSNYDFVSRPVEPRAFALLVEKTLLVEKYRRMMNLVSKESESRIEVFEYLLSTKNSKEQDVNLEKGMFLKILDFEKKFMQEQLKLNDSIRNIALLRKSEFLAMKDRINAEEMLSDLRRKELIDANRIITAQEGLIEFSSKQFDEAKRIIDARENVQELSRAEAIKLHEEIKELKKKLHEADDKNSKLTVENSELKKQLNS